MSEESSNEQIDSYVKGWWEEAPHHKTRNKWRPLVKFYLDMQGHKASQVKFSLQLVKHVVKFAGAFDKDWMRFPVESFDPDTYKAHEAIYEVIKDELDKLIDAEKAKAEAKMAK